MKQLILVEGLPGTGKTTTTQKLRDHFALQGEKVVALFEGDERIPGDFFDMAGIPIAEFISFRLQHPETADHLAAISLCTENYLFVRLDRCPAWAVQFFRKWDMGDESNRQISVAEYIPCALERLDHWVAANIDSDDIFIIDSGFLQNPINELLFRKASDDDVIFFINSIIKKLEPLNPLCVYLKRESADIAISFARHTKGREWSARVDALLKECDCPHIFEQRFELECSLLSGIAHIVCPVSGSDWSEVDRLLNEKFIHERERFCEVTS